MPAESAVFNEFIRSFGFDPDKLDSTQLKSMRGWFEQQKKRDEKEARAAEGDESEDQPAGFEEYVESLGFSLDGLTPQQRASLQELFEDDDPDSDFDDDTDEDLYEDENEDDDDLDAAAGGSQWIQTGPELGDLKLNTAESDDDDPNYIQT